MTHYNKQTDIIIVDLKPNKTPLWLGKILNYEYWPIWFFYIPISFYLVYWAFRAKSFTFFTCVNPSIKDSGIVNYSKFGVLSNIPERYKPNGVLIKASDNIHQYLQLLKYPLIAKPDMGERGKGVKVIHNQTELIAYAQATEQDFIIQDYCDFPLEAAIFYIRKPSESRGRISSFTTKEFLSVEGNGKSTVKELMSLTFRGRLQIEKQSLEVLNFIPSVGQYFKIEAIGNHNRGTRFINSNHMISDKLLNVFDNISTKIPGFYYGRYDLKYKCLEDLENGINFKIVELNGVNSEPVHIYDQSTGLINAYNSFFKHIKYMFLISEENKKLGFPRTGFLDFWKRILFN